MQTCRMKTSRSSKYIASLYWAYATMTTVATVCYGDIYPITNLEKIFAMLSMLVACCSSGIFAYVVGSIETIVRRSNTIESLFKELQRENTPCKPVFNAPKHYQVN